MSKPIVILYWEDTKEAIHMIDSVVVPVEEYQRLRQAETDLAACQRSRTLLHLEVAEYRAMATGDFYQAQQARAAYLAAE